MSGAEKVNPARDGEFNHIQGVGERREGKGHSAVRIVISLRRLGRAKGEVQGSTTCAAPAGSPGLECSSALMECSGTGLGRDAGPVGPEGVRSFLTSSQMLSTLLQVGPEERGR